MKSSKYIPPNPSEPAKIPTKIKTINDGIPKRPPSLLKSTAVNNKIPAIKIPYSMTLLLLLCKVYYNTQVDIFIAIRRTCLLRFLLMPDKVLSKILQGA